MEEIIIKQRQTRLRLMAVIDEAELPACILTPILKDLYEEIKALEEPQYKLALNIQKENKQKELKKDKPKKESVKND